MLQIPTVNKRYSIVDIVKAGNDWAQNETPAAPRKGKGYGVSVTSAETARTRWKLRKRMTDFKMKRMVEENEHEGALAGLKLCMPEILSPKILKVYTGQKLEPAFSEDVCRRLCDYTLVLSISGLALAMLDVEVCSGDLSILSEWVSLQTFSELTRLTIMALTGLLLITLTVYHTIDCKVYLVETGSDSWRIGLTRSRILRFLGEIAICAICPPPKELGAMEWSVLSGNPELAGKQVTIPYNVLIVLPMFLRLYLLCRYIVVHSSHYKDCAARTIASLNHISVDFGFVAKSQMYERPLYTLSVVTFCFWVVISWMLTQCERYTAPSLSMYQHFFDYLWFEIITFFSIGYGDIQVQTYCGRGLAMLTAIVGTLFSSTLIALVGRRLALSSSEKRVNHLIAENQLSKNHKHAAARVLQNTWRIVLRQREVEQRRSTNANLRLTNAQRALLRAIISFRKIRWNLRMQMEEEDDYFTARRAFMETEDRLQRVRQRQHQLDSRLVNLFAQVETLTHIVQVKCPGPQKNIEISKLGR